MVYNYQNYKKQELEIIGIAKTSYTTYLYGEKKLNIYSKNIKLMNWILEYGLPKNNKMLK